MALPLQPCPTWNLQQPPSGLDGRYWSAGWFVRTAVDAWARELPDVAEVVRELEAVDGCSYVEVLAAGPHENGTFDLVVTASLETQREAYSTPVRQVTVHSPRLCRLAKLDGPRAPIDAQLEPIEAEIKQGADYDQIREALRPHIALTTIRRLGARDLANRKGEPLRPRLLRRVRGKVKYRTPRRPEPAFTDMKQEELAQLVDEAVHLASAVRTNPTEFWPLLPAELKQIRRPPPVRRRPRDYDRLLDEAGWEDELERARPSKTLARDLLLLRLGYDPKDEAKQTALRVALHRHKR